MTGIFLQVDNNAEVARHAVLRIDRTGNYYFFCAACWLIT